MGSFHLNPNLDIKNKVTLITGGASGIGRTTAELFSEKGARVVIFDNSPNVFDVAEQVGRGTMGIKVDISDCRQISEALERVLYRFERIEILCNIAGVGHSAPPEEIREEDWNQVLSVNLTSLFLMSQKVGQIMIRQGKGGKIINMSSQAGVVAIPGHTAYSASKAGVIAVTKALALDWGQYNINVNAVSPTVVLTPMAKDYWVGKRAEAHLRQIPKGRFASPEEVAFAVLYLASPASDIINGTNLVLDGGFTVVRN